MDPAAKQAVKGYPLHGLDTHGNLCLRANGNRDRSFTAFLYLKYLIYYNIICSGGQYNLCHSGEKGDCLCLRNGEEDGVFY